MAAPTPVARPLLEAEPSFRELGGCATADGNVVRSGRLYRAGLLRTLKASDRRTLRSTGITWRLDLRSRAEQVRETHVATILREIRSAEWEQEDGLAGVQPSQWAQQLQDPGFTPALVRELLLGSYHEMPRVLAPALRVLFAKLQSGEAPVLIHCTAGKDRTGFVCALLLTALGADEEAVLDDYLRSNEHMPDPGAVLARYERYKSIKPHADAAAVIEAIYRTEPDYLDCALCRIRTDWGSAENYLHDMAGCNADVRETLRSSLLAP